MPGLAKSRAGMGAVKAEAPTKAAVVKRSAIRKADREAAPISAGDFAKQQIARLEAMLAGLIDKANAGESAAVDRILKILDRLDRYHGFSSPTAPVESANDARERILQKLSDVDARRAAAKDDG
jgi:hypothetical protein